MGKDCIAQRGEPKLNVNTLCALPPHSVVNTAKLFLQAVTGHEECVDALLQHGAKCLLRDSRGRTPIHLSAACGHIGVLGALLQSATSVDANPAIVDNHGYTALHWACYNG